MCDFLKTFLDTNHEHCLKFMQSLLLHIFEIVQMVGFAGVPQKCCIDKANDIFNISKLLSL